jgi:hypothetical protein
VFGSPYKAIRFELQFELWLLLHDGLPLVHILCFQRKIIPKWSWNTLERIQRNKIYWLWLKFNGLKSSWNALERIQRIKILAMIKVQHIK